MKIKRIRVKGTVPSPGVLEFNADDLHGAPIVAIVGANGVGKSAFLETIPGVAYRSMPSRGSVAEIATGPDTELDIILETDHVFGLHVNIDGSKTPRTMAGYVNDGERKPGEKAWAVTKYDAEVAKLLPPESIYLASAFGSQKGTGRFLDAAPAERRSILAELIGAGRWQEKSVAAGKRLREVQTERVRVEAERDAALRRVDGEAQAKVDAAVASEDAAAVALQAAEKMNVERKRNRAEYDAKISALKAEEAALIEKGKALKAAYDLDCVNRARDWGAREDRRRQDHEAAKAEIRALGTAQLNAFTAVHSAWEQRRDAHIKELGAATLEAVRLQEAADRLGKVPCGGNGEFAACPLIASAVEAKGAIVAAVRKRNELLAIPDEPEPVQPDKTPELAEAMKKRDAMEVAEPEPTNPAEPPEIQAARNELTMVRQNTMHANCPPSETDVKPLRDRADSCARELARLTEVARQSEKASREAEEAGGEVATLAVEEDDWRTLQDACGAKGIQAFLVDAAAPEITATCNDLLHSCYGPRYSVRLTTQAAKAAGGVKEVCDLTVLDGERGTDGSASLKSGGERVILGEALAMALTIYHKRRSPIPIADMIRDECAGALDSENAVAYIRMLRKAREIMGGDGTIYFVSHVPALWALADARVRLSAGKIEVET